MRAIRGLALSVTPRPVLHSFAMSAEGNGGNPFKLAEAGFESEEPRTDVSRPEDSSLVLAHPRFDPAEVFFRHFLTLERALAERPFPGFLAAVAHGEQLTTTWVAASQREVRAAVIGRHNRTTLALPRDHATAALRHLVLLVRLVEGCPEARLLDLQTEIGFADPEGRRFEAIRTNAPTFVSAGGAVLILLPTGLGHRLPSGPENAWESLAKPRWIDARRGEPTERAAQEPVVLSTDGPRGCRSTLCRAEEIPYGMVTIASGPDEATVRISGRALDEGIILGRYDRCEVGGPEADESLSRVHLLVVREGNQVLAVDTASTNGTYVGDDRVHLLALTDQCRLDLGGVIDLTWRNCH